MQELTQDNFESVIQEGTVLVDFYATWCGPCKMLAPQFQLAEEELEGIATLYKVDTDKLSEEQKEKYGVMGVPTVVLYKDGVEVDLFKGFRPVDAIVDFVKESL